MKTQRRWIALMGLVAAVSLAGCAAGGGDADGASAGSGADRAEPAGPGQPEAAPGQAEQGAGDGAVDGDRSGTGDDADAGGLAGGVQVEPRSIIYTGSVTVRVEDVDEAAASVSALVTGYGGFIGADQRTSDDERSRATMTLRIPSDRFTEAVDELGRIGDEQSREISTEDVTEEMVDVESRIATAEASVERTRALLAEAETIAEIVSVEGELTRREADLASLQARQRTLEDLTTLSTITVRLLGPAAEPPDDEPRTGFVGGLDSGWDAFTTSMRALLTAFGFLLPWLALSGVAATALVWWARRRRTPRPALEPEPANPSGT